MGSSLTGGGGLMLGIEIPSLAHPELGGTGVTPKQGAGARPDGSAGRKGLVRAKIQLVYSARWRNSACLVGVHSRGGCRLARGSAGVYLPRGEGGRSSGGGKAPTPECMVVRNHEPCELVPDPSSHSSEGRKAAVCEEGSHIHPQLCTSAAT